MDRLRSWRFAIHTTRKRLLDLRIKELETGEERGCRPFEVLNLGRYERKYWKGITFDNEPKSDEETALAAYVKFILDLYKAQPIQGTHVHGKKGGAFVHVGAVDAPVTISQIEEPRQRPSAWAAGSYTSSAGSSRWACTIRSPSTSVLNTA